jgi:F-type H+-transporting ATPase subunit gamma
VLHSHACENLSRLQAMVAAQDNLARLRSAWGPRSGACARKAITAEVLSSRLACAGSVEPPP